MAGTGKAHLRTDGDVVLTVEDLVVEFPMGRNGVVSAVAGISFDVLRGETLGIVGESGCGKSTTGRAVMQISKPTSGSVEFEGRELTALDSETLREARTRIQMIFQDPISSLNPRRRVRDSVRDPLDIWSRGTDAERAERVDETLEKVGIDPARAAESRPHQFSGGQCQRISIARALVLDPTLIICDEPVSALDVSVQAQVLNLLEDLKQEYGLTLIFIAHDLAVVKNISDRVAVMYLGKLCEVAPSDTLYVSPAHPYTKVLLDSIPVPDPSVTVAGEPAVGVPVPPALPPRRRPLRRGRTHHGGGGARSLRGMPPPAGDADYVAPVTLRSLRRTLAAFRASGRDPTTRLTDRSFVHATYTPDGPATVRVTWDVDPAPVDRANLAAEAWGPGRAWLLGQVEAMTGAADSGATLPDSPAVVRRAMRLAESTRIGASSNLYHLLLPTVIAQRITAGQAFQQWSRLCWQLGEPAPGPPSVADRLRLPPSPESLRRPSWWFHRLGIEDKRARTLTAVASHAGSYWAWDDRRVASERLGSIPGIGAWTVGSVIGPAYGDPDAVPVGDFHFPNIVAWNLAGEPRGDDDRMLELLAPFAGQRGRVLQALTRHGDRPPAFGPRRRVLAIQDL